ncbi:MAG: fimbrillin family protein [Bacteroidales bacterium]|nr:fimbrillin family protein [Bacteroidales bacterium]
MKIYPYIAASALLLAVAACSSDDEMTVTPYDANPNAVRIQPSVSGIVVTRTTPEADVSTQFANGDQLNVSRDGASFYTYTLDGNSWLPQQGTSYLMWSSATETTMQLQAYYPIAASMTAFTLPKNQSGEKDENAAEDEPYQIADADYMTYSGTVTKGTNNSATFTMQRRTARIRVTIDGFGDQYAADSKCSVKIYSPFTIANVDYSGTEPAVTGTGNALPITPLNSADMGTNSTATALVVPSATATDNENFMEVTIDGETLYVKGIPAHEAGYSYDYRLTVGKNGIVINSVQVNPWNEPTNVEGGEAEEDPGLEVDEDTHSITLLQNGILTESAIAKAVGDSKTLVIKGFMSENDFSTLATYIKNNLDAISTLDMGDCTSTEIPDMFLSHYTSGYDIIKIPITSLVLPKGTVSIGLYAFRSTNITSLTLPETVETIKPNAFEEGNLKEVTIPRSVKNFGAYMFWKQAELESVTFEGTTPPFCGTMLFPDNLKAIYVPEGTKDSYLLRLNYDPSIDWDNIIQEY